MLLEEFYRPTKETKANIIHRTNDRLNGMKLLSLFKRPDPLLL